MDCPTVSTSLSRIHRNIIQQTGGICKQKMKKNESGSRKRTDPKVCPKCVDKPQSMSLRASAHTGVAIRSSSKSPCFQGFQVTDRHTAFCLRQKCRHRSLVRDDRTDIFAFVYSLFTISSIKGAIMSISGEGNDGKPHEKK